VQKDELLVDANQRVTHEALLELRSLRNLEEARAAAATSSIRRSRACCSCCCSSRCS
jgi:hypothetical protein